MASIEDFLFSVDIISGWLRRASQVDLKPKEPGELLPICPGPTERETIVWACQNLPDILGKTERLANLEQNLGMVSWIHPFSALHLRCVLHAFARLDWVMHGKICHC